MDDCLKYFAGQVRAQLLVKGQHQFQIHSPILLSFISLSQYSTHEIDSVE
jgi:hypothetical protein